MSDLQVSLRLDGRVDPSYQSALKRAEAGLQRYGQEVGQITAAHRRSGAAVPGVRSDYDAAGAAADAYTQDVGEVTSAHRLTGAAVPGVRSDYDAAGAAADAYTQDVGEVTSAHRLTGAAVPGVRSDYDAAGAAADAYTQDVGEVTSAHRLTGAAVPGVRSDYDAAGAAADAYTQDVGEVTSAHRLTGAAVPGVRSDYDAAGAAADAYTQDVGEVTSAHRLTGAAVPGVRSDYDAAGAAADAYTQDVGEVTSAHRLTGAAVPGVRSDYDAAGAAADAYTQDVGEVTSAHRLTGAAVPGVRSDYDAAGAAADAYTQDVGEVTRAHEKLQDEIKETGTATTGMFSSLSSQAERRKEEAATRMRNYAIAGAGIAYSVGRLIGGAFDLEEQGLNLRTVINAPDKDAAVERAKRHARAISRDSLIDADEALEIEYALNSAGLGEDVSRAGIERVHQVAKVTRGAAEQVGEVVGITFNNMAANMTGAAEEKLGRIADVLAKTQFKYQIRDFGQLGEGLAEGASAATSSLVPFETLAATIGVLNTAGQQGSEAGTAFNAVLRNMNKAAEELGFEIERTATGEFDMVANLQRIDEALDGLDIDERSQVLQDIWGDEGRVGIVPLLANIDRVREGITTLEDAGGTVDEAYRPFLESGGGQWTMLGQNVKQVGEIFATTLLPALNSVVEPMTTGAAWAAEMIEKYPQVGRLVGAVAVGFGIVATGLAVASAAVWVFNAALLANPITWVVGALIVGASLVYTYWDEVGGFFSGLWEDIAAGGKWLGEQIEGFFAPVTNLIEWLSESEWAGWIAEQLGASRIDVGARPSDDEEGSEPAPAPDPKRRVGGLLVAGTLSAGLVAGSAAAGGSGPAVEGPGTLAAWQSVVDSRPALTSEREQLDEALADGVKSEAQAFLEALDGSSPPGAQAPRQTEAATVAGETPGFRAAPPGAAQGASLVFHQTFNIEGGGSEVVDEVRRQMEAVMREVSVERGLVEAEDAF